MTGALGRWVVEVHLVNGRLIEQHITAEEASRILKSRAFIWKGGESEEQKQASAIFTIFAQRLDKGVGSVSVTDPEHRTWLIPVKSILAINISDPTEGSALGRFGFVPPVVEEAWPAVGLPTSIAGAKRKR